MMMATVNTEQSAENMEYVRRLLKQKQPGFSAALEWAADLVGRELEGYSGRPVEVQANYR
jgi:hypothetical protein